MANGWRLGDEPGCATVRMFVDCGVHRVPKKMTERDVCSPRPVKNISDNVRHNQQNRAAQQI
jgi:hypothetical protein